MNGIVPAVLLLGSVVSAIAEPSIPPPRDVAFPGAITLSVDVSDIDRRVFRVRETIPVGAPGDLVLLYPKWLPGTHAPVGPIDRLAGITARAGADRLVWTRDPLDVFAFHVAVPPGAAVVDLEFQYLSPVSERVGRAEVSPEVLVLDWESVVLYPAGHDARRIPFDVRLTLPEGWTQASALDVASTDGSRVTFSRTSLERLIDSPVRAGRHHRRYDLAPGDAVPVRLELFAQTPNLLEIDPTIVGRFRALVQEAYYLFGSRHYDRYGFLMSLSDSIGHDTTLEHLRSAEYGESANAFSEYDKTAGGRDVIAHEYVHSWNGKFRRPADLWVPNYNVPMRNSLLWVYEGGTQYWGHVLTARAGFWTKEQALEDLAISAAALDAKAGRTWRALQDTTHDEIINPRRPMSWESWQRFEDYYSEGALLWLDADTLIRERSKGARSLDDFARSFFGVGDGSEGPVLYTFDEVVAALNRVERFDWAAFLRTRLDANAAGAPLDGIERGGYRLVFTDAPGEVWTSLERQRKSTDLSFSLGIVVDEGHTLAGVRWGSPAFEAGLTAGTALIAVNGFAFDPDKLLDAIRRGKETPAPLELLVRNGDRYRTVRIDYHGGLRYPRLERDAARPALLDAILAPRR